jgi:hypothetical protein
MAEQVARVARPSPRLEIGRRGGGDVALPARTQRDCDHVLLEPLVVAHSGVEAGREDVDEAVLRHHLQPDAGKGGEESRGDGREHDPGDDARHVQPKRSRGAVAIKVEIVEGGGDFVQRRPEPGEQPQPRLGGGDASGGAVEQPDTQPRLQPADCLAQRGRGDSAAGGGAAKAASPGHRREGVEIGEIGLNHCANSRTACAELTGLSHASPSAISLSSPRGLPAHEGEAIWNSVNSAAPAPSSPPSASARWACRPACTATRTKRKGSPRSTPHSSAGSAWSTPAISTESATTSSWSARP